MKLLFDSFWRAVFDCLRPRVLLLSLGPLLIAGALVLGVNYVFWEPMTLAVRAQMESWSLVNSALQWMSSMLGPGFRTVITLLIVVALEIPVVVALTLVLVGLLVTPGAVALVSRRRFPGLEKRRGGSWWGGFLGALGWTALALLAVLATMWLWLIPGMVLVLPPLIWGWLTARVMAYDVLADHADAAELRGLLRAHRWPMLVMGIVSGFICGVPSLLWTFSATLLILAPYVLPAVVWLYALIYTFASLWFAHYALAALARLRAAEAAMRAAQAAPAGAPVPPLIEEVPLHERGPSDPRAADAG